MLQTKACYGYVSPLVWVSGDLLLEGGEVAAALLVLRQPGVGQRLVHRVAGLVLHHQALGQPGLAQPDTTVAWQTSILLFVFMLYFFLQSALYLLSLFFTRSPLFCHQNFFLLLNF